MAGNPQARPSAPPPPPPPNPQILPPARAGSRAGVTSVGGVCDTAITHARLHIERFNGLNRAQAGERETAARTGGMQKEANRRLPAHAPAQSEKRGDVLLAILVSLTAAKAPPLCNQ